MMFLLVKKMDSFVTKCDLVVKKSQIPDAGVGVFSNNDIVCGTIIGKYEGMKMPADTPLMENELKYTYCVRKGDIIVVPFKNCILRYINDNINLYRSSVLNTRYNYNFTHNVKFIEINGDVYMQTIRHISSGEELFVHYGNEYWGSYIRENQRKILRKKVEQSGNFGEHLAHLKRMHTIKEERGYENFYITNI